MPEDLFMYTRKNIQQYRNNLKYKNENYPDDKYVIMHPNELTAYADVLVFLEELCPETKRIVIIPVNKVIMVIVPYFEKMLNGK